MAKRKHQSSNGNGSASRPAVMIVTGSSPYLARSLPELLVQAGAEVTLAAPESLPLHQSRFVKQSIAFDPRSDAALEQLENTVARQQPQLVVVADEPLVFQLLKTKDEVAPFLRKHVHFPADLALRSKAHGWMVAKNIPAPPGQTCLDYAAAETCLNQWGNIYLKCDGTSGGLGVRHVTCSTDLKQAWTELGDTAILAQKALDGVVGATEIVARQGNLLAWASSEKFRVARPRGPSIARRLTTPPGMAELVAAVVEASGAHGLCGFDWVVDTADGKPRLIEFHPRPPSGFGLGRWAGVDFALAMRRLLEEDNAPSLAPDGQGDGEICCYFPDHLTASLCRKQWRELARWVPFSGNKSWALSRWNDLPLLRSMARSAWKKR